MSFQANLVCHGFLSSDSNLDPYGHVAGTDHQYKVVKLSGGQVSPVTAVGDVAYGVLQDHPGLNEAAQVAVGGVSKVEAGGVVTAGNPQYLLADGTVADASETGARFIGTALESGVDGDIVAVRLADLNATTATEA